MRIQFLMISLFLFILFGALGTLWTPIYFIFIVLIPLFFLGIKDMLQSKRAVLKNFPVIGHFRYLLEMVRPEIQQYFIEGDTDGMPVSREFRSVVYQRAKKELDTVPFGTIRDVYQPGYEWINHSITPKHVDPTSLRVVIGNSLCKQPYNSSIFNISAMSYGSLSKNAILALNGGAHDGSFFHNTGEGGISSYHIKNGGDLVWQIGTGYFGCRTPEGNFDPEKFKDQANIDNVKMIEIKISQGAKPAHGGILPAAKITDEIAQIRGVEKGKDVISPPYHKAFKTPIELLNFIQNLRELSNGKPVGFKICVGHKREFFSICKAMMEMKIYPDFITVDGSEGGTGAAPLEFTNSIGVPLEEGLTFVHDCLTGFDLKKHIKIIATGKMLTGFHILKRLCLGADIVASGRAMMLALGCIQARRCNSNDCPVGVATNNPNLVVGLHPGIKRVRVSNYHKQTVKAVAEIMGATGADNLDSLRRIFVNRRINLQKTMSYQELFPEVITGSFLDGELPEKYALPYKNAQASQFY